MQCSDASAECSYSQVWAAVAKRLLTPFRRRSRCAGDLCRKHNVLLLVDTVCSLGGVPLYADAWKVRRWEGGGVAVEWGWYRAVHAFLVCCGCGGVVVVAMWLLWWWVVWRRHLSVPTHPPRLSSPWIQVDAIYSGSQKCLSAPPGAAPLMLNDRALEKIRARKTKVRGGLGWAGLGWVGWGGQEQGGQEHGGCSCGCCRSGAQQLQRMGHTGPPAAVIPTRPPGICVPPLPQVRSYYFDLNLVGDYW